MKKRSLIIILLIGILGITSSLMFLFKNSDSDKVDVDTSIDIDVIKEDVVGNAFATGISVTTGNLDIKNIEENIVVKTGNITVLMPAFLFDSELRDLVKDMESDGIIVDFQTIENFDDYRKTVKAELDAKNGADVLLIPSDWLETVDNYSVKLDLGEQQISPFFHSVFAPYVDQKNYSFVPYILDPLVTYVSDDVNISEKELGLEQILSYLNLYDGKKSLSIPVLRGADKNDVRFLGLGGESFPNYFSILYNLLYQLDQGNDRAVYKTFLDLTVSDLSYSWDFVSYKQLYKRILLRNDSCDLYPSICLMAYKMGNIRFGFLSDQGIWKQYFGEAGRSVNDVQIYNFPLGADDYKVKGWGFVSPKYSSKSHLVEKFLQKYLKAGVRGELSVWDSTLSPFINVLAGQKINKKYANIFRYENKFSLLFGSMELQKNFLEETEVEEFLKKEISVDVFLENIKWEW